MKTLITIVIVFATALYAFPQNFGIDNSSPQEKLHVNGDLRVGSGEINSDVDHLQLMSGVRADDNSYEWIGFYSGGTRQGIILYDGQWTGANNLSDEFSITSENNNKLTLNTNNGHIAMMPKNGNVGIGTTSPGFKLHVPSGYIGTDYINTTDNVVSSGVTGIIVKQGDNYHRTADANAIRAFIGNTGADNLGNHSATTTLSMNNNAIVGFGRLEPYGTSGSSGQGAHSYAIFQEDGGWSHPYPDLRIAYHTGIKLGAHFSYNGIRFYNNSDMVTQTMSVGDGDNNVRIYYDLRVPFIYDMNNTGYYWNGDGTSRMYYGDFNYLHTTNDSWFPYTGNNHNYFRGQAYCWNAHWYDENNTGYYFNADNTSRLAYVYQGVGANNVGGWTSGRIQTESTSDGHQYHPLTGNWGYIGTSGQYWYYSYAASHVNMSQRELKRNIVPLDEPLYKYVMADIDNIKPSFYKVKGETDELEKGNEPKYRPNMHLGVILDESPDYVQDQAFSGIDIYALATLGIAGVKHNREEIKQLKQTISDFGNETLQGSQSWVPFSNEFVQKNGSGAIPVVTATANLPGVTLSITETTTKGFKVVRSGDASAASFNWIAMAKIDATREKNTAPEIPAVLAKQLNVDESKKAPIKAYWEQQKLKGQQEHAKQAAEHDRLVAVGKSNYMETTAPKEVKPCPGVLPPADKNLVQP